MTETVWLQRPGADVPWGFRLHGGRDYQEPLRVQRVTVGSIAATGLTTGDVIVKIGDTDTSSLTFAQAQDVVKNAENLLQLCIIKGGSGLSTQQAQQFGAKLDQQLSNMSLNKNSPSNYPFGGGQTGPQYNSPAHPPGAPGCYERQGSWGQPTVGQRPPSPETTTPHTPPSAEQHRMPDAILNMAAKGEQDKKPFSYAPDMSTIVEQRNKVRHRPPKTALPKYQHMLNLPNFEDPPRHVGVTSPPSSHVTQQQQPQYPDDGGVSEGPVVHSQYNSPLQMYTSDNVEEAFKGQSGGEIMAVKGLQQKDQHDITQSPVYRMIHGMDGQKQRPRPQPRPTNPEAYGGHARHIGRLPRQPSEDDELTFSGLNKDTDIPSKSFHVLQRMTSNEPEIDTTSIRPRGRQEEEEDVGNYDETSIRYRGKNIPSKSFKMLQNMTGGEQERLAPPGPAARRVRKKEPEEDQEPQQDYDDIVDIRFVGGNIPSRSFRMLQQQVGAEQEEPPKSTGGDPPRTVKVVHIRPPKQQQHNDPSGVTDF